jgi:oligopeptide transport system substrate-binding protein
MNGTKRRAGGILAACLVSVLLAIGVSVASADTGKDTLVFTVDSEVQGIDPQKANSQPSMNVGTHIFEGLIRVHDGKIAPGMADRWTLSKDGRTYTFHIRDGARWNDGSKLTAKDFEYAFIRLLDPRTAAEYAFAAYYLKNGRDFNLGKIKDPKQVGVKAPDDRTLVLTLEHPTSYFLGYLNQMCFMPVRRSQAEKFGEKFATDADKLAYNGPFLLQEWKHEQKMVLVKNPTYWNAKAIRLNRVEILQVNDTGTALSMFENGDLDLVDVPSNLYKSYQEKGLAKVYLSGADDWMKVNVRKNPQKPWLADKNFRKALAYAVDRGDYVNISTKGLYLPNRRYVLPIIQGVKGAYGAEYPLAYYPLKADPTKAKDYLKKALGELKIKDPGSITVEYLIQDQDETRLMAETLQNQIERTLGIHVKIKLVTRKQRFEMEHKGDYDLVYHGWAPDYDDPMTYMEVWEGGSSQNNSGYANGAYDKLIGAARVEVNPKKRMDMIFAAEKILLDDAPMIPLQLRRKAWSARKELMGLSRPIIGANIDFVYAYKK